ncbi:hypothetical protein H4R33_000211 [Dimargaris cristalligena]|uniref:3,4-dihydroxy-2-butanone 4-phosphate synthase n=1 Tax=Dimargaris cristalligena TaxID=215637 RepID=A0A4P9ZY58_9FUNG|nr:hypothetical protein H4R33_000211 [Dimargaris cristalligena]RKP38613.1 3,4-dihydroxy-2-butanone 4-phosphate synthase [Dimargaris cristalligena]|eukprot:RKP38613.1 3,4-dihydroxy-2-butanone 4-phosphate synthase [Dimargaris cristalligena]
MTAPVESVAPQSAYHQVAAIKAEAKAAAHQAASAVTFDSIPDALAEFAKGNMVVVVDNEDRENEGDLIFAADAATVEKFAFTIRYSSGYVCCSLPEERMHQLQIPMMVEDNTDYLRTAYGITVDYRHGTTTGISAHDRCLTVRALANPQVTDPSDFARPGHMLPLRAAPNGVLQRQGHTETGLDLCRLTGRNQAAVLCELVNDDGSMKRRDDCYRFAREHNLKLITIADLMAYRRAHNC